LTRQAAPAATRLLGALLHEIAQPAAAANLAIDTAALTLERGDTTMATRRVAAAQAQSERLLTMIRALSEAARGGGGGMVDAGLLLAESVPGATVPATPLLACFHQNLLREALRSMAVALRADPARCGAATQGPAGGVRLWLVGPGTAREPWVTVLRLAGAQVTVRRQGEALRIGIDLPAA
jgi:signal transduction histidine kinase